MSSSPPLEFFQKLTGKYRVTKSGSRKQLALRLWKLRQHIMTLAELKTIEDYLKMPPSKRFNGQRFGYNKNKETIYKRRVTRKHKN